MPTAEELAPSMRNKSSIELKGILTKPQDWTEEALTAAANELNSRGITDLDDPELGAWSSERDRLEPPPLQLNKPKSINDCQYCGKEFSAFSIWGEDSKTVINDIPFHKKCSRKYAIALRLNTLAEFISKKSDFDLSIGIENCFLPTKAASSNKDYIKEYVGLLVFCNHGIIYLARDPGLTNSASQLSTIAGARSGGVLGAAMGVIIGEIIDHKARGKNKAANDQKITLKILEHHCKTAIDAFHLKCNEIISIKATKGLSTFGDSIILVVTTIGSFSFKARVEDHAEIESKLLEFREKYLSRPA
jgi:hypothetical protein